MMVGGSVEGQGWAGCLLRCARFRDYGPRPFRRRNRSELYVHSRLLPPWRSVQCLFPYRDLTAVQISSYSRVLLPTSLSG